MLQSIMNTVEHLAVERLFVKTMLLIVSPCVNNNPLMLISSHVSVLSHSCGLATNKSIKRMNLGQTIRLVGSKHR